MPLFSTTQTFSVTPSGVEGSLMLSSIYLSLDSARDDFLGDSLGEIKWI